MSVKMVERPWLRVGGWGKRTIHTMTMKYYSPAQVYDLILLGQWPYRNPDKAIWYHTRDRALASLLYLTSGRVNEVLKVTADQFRVDVDDPDFLVLHDFYVSKRKKGREHPRPDIPLPRVGSLSPFTKLVESYLVEIGPTDKLFKFTSSRALAIIDSMTKLSGSSHKGMFNHWFRSQSFSYQVNLIRSTIIVAKDRGVENPSTLSHYYTGSWKEHKEDLKK